MRQVILSNKRGKKTEKKRREGGECDGSRGEGSRSLSGGF